MCGRIAYYSEQSELESFLETKINIDFSTSYNICPTDKILILKDQSKLEVAKWGLIPPWVKDSKTILINARAETVASKPSFKEAFKKRRCLVLANGFYEWKREKGSPPQPHFINSSNQPIMAFAGVFNEGTGSEPLSNVSILTTEANKIMSTIHDRMPVILEKGEWEGWFYYSERDKENLELLKPYKGDLKIRKVSIAVSDVRNKSEECIL